MNINIYYGGRGIIDDPTIFVTEVLEELRVKVRRYNLYDVKNEIMTWPQTLKDTDGIILASTLEWFGMGGYMLEFLDACWLFGNKEKIASIYMMPVVLSTTYGEDEVMQQLNTAWMTLGGKLCQGIAGYIESSAKLEMNGQYISILDKRAENLYRMVNQKMISLPSSLKSVRQAAAVRQSGNLTPQESEQLSKYVSDDSYVKRQKEDIQELAGMFMDKLKRDGAGDETEFVSEFKAKFKPIAGLRAVYVFNIPDKDKPFVIKISDGRLECVYGEADKPDVTVQASRDVLQGIISGDISFDMAFMKGKLSMKGNFNTYKQLDQMFQF